MTQNLKNKTADPNYFKNYYQRNKDKMKENSRKHYLKNKGCVSGESLKIVITRKAVIVSFD